MDCVDEDEHEDEAAEDQHTHDNAEDGEAADPIFTSIYPQTALLCSLSWLLLNIFLCSISPPVS